MMTSPASASLDGMDTRPKKRLNQATIQLLIALLVVILVCTIAMAIQVIGNQERTIIALAVKFATECTVPLS